MSDVPVSFASFAGVDLHKQTVTLRAVDPAGRPIAALTCDTRCVDRIRDWMLALPRPSHLAVEAVGFVEWFIDRFRPCVDRMDIADATELANRRGKRRKTDRNDALDIALRLARGECPLGWIADEPVPMTPTLLPSRSLSDLISSCAMNTNSVHGVWAQISLMSAPREIATMPVPAPV